VFAHFEVVPDHLPDALKEGIQKFPPGTLQFEIGIQSFNPEVQAKISRKQNNQKAEENIRWLCQNSHAHLHVDLIAGLPGETVESFARGFNQLYALQAHEIQFGILKRLRGTPIIRHTEEYALVFDPYPPYTILSNKDIPFAEMQKLIRFARYWDLIANSGRFSHTLKLILGQHAFENFMDLSNWIYLKTDATHRIALDRLANLVSKWLIEERGLQADVVAACLASDYAGDAKHLQGSSPMDKPAMKKKINQLLLLKDRQGIYRAFKFLLYFLYPSARTGKRLLIKYKGLELQGGNLIFVLIACTNLFSGLCLDQKRP